MFIEVTALSLSTKTCQLPGTVRYYHNSRQSSVPRIGSVTSEVFVVFSCDLNNANYTSIHTFLIISRLSRSAKTGSSIEVSTTTVHCLNSSIDGRSNCRCQKLINTNGVEVRPC
jgi:hypothetical protein